MQNGRRKKLPNRTTHLDTIFDYLRENRNLGLEQVCKNLSITKNIGRLIYYTLDKKDRNDLQKQPFCFLRPKYRRKPYDISLGKIATTSNNQIKLKEALTDLKDYSYETI